MKLLSALLPKHNKVVTSYYMIKKWCKHIIFLDISSQKHTYCFSCQSPLQDVPCHIRGCSKTGYFLSANIGNQRKERFKGILYIYNGHLAFCMCINFSSLLLWFKLKGAGLSNDYCMWFILYNYLALPTCLYRCGVFQSSFVQTNQYFYIPY